MRKWHLVSSNILATTLKSQQTPQGDYKVTNNYIQIKRPASYNVTQLLNYEAHLRHDAGSLREHSKEEDTHFVLHKLLVYDGWDVKEHQQPSSK